MLRKLRLRQKNGFPTKKKKRVFIGNVFEEHWISSLIWEDLQSTLWNLCSSANQLLCQISLKIYLVSACTSWPIESNVNKMCQAYNLQVNINPLVPGVH